MPHQAYGWKHQQVRAQLLKQLRAVGVTLCPLCFEPLTADMQIDLHHSSPALKQAGIPGDMLTHSHCNRSAGNLQRSGKKPESQRRKLQSRPW